MRLASPPRPLPEPGPSPALETFQALLAQLSSAYQQLHSEREALSAQLHDLRLSGAGEASGERGAADAWRAAGSPRPRDAAGASAVSLPWVLRKDPVVAPLQPADGEGWDPLDEHMVPREQTAALQGAPAASLAEAGAGAGAPELSWAVSEGGGAEPEARPSPKLATKSALMSSMSSSSSSRALRTATGRPSLISSISLALGPLRVDVEEIREQFIRLDTRTVGELSEQDLWQVLSREPDCPQRPVFQQALQHWLGALGADGTDSVTIFSTVDSRKPSTYTAGSGAICGFDSAPEAAVRFEAFCALVTEERLPVCLSLEECTALEQLRDALQKEAGAHRELRTEAIEDVGSNVMDTVSAIVILLNAVLIGFSTDADENEAGWQVSEALFTAFFFLELLIKLRRNGSHQFFMGVEWPWNYFDLTVVGIAILDLAFTLALRPAQGAGATLSSPESEGSEDSLEVIMILKMVRICRLARLVRLLRFKAFHELKMMIQGVFAGLRVLFWAVVLLVFCIYVLALVMVKFVGSASGKYTGNRSFETVPWAMFTLFRCFTDGCSAFDGTPLTVHMYSRIGPAFMIGYIMVTLFVLIGIFNLIMAIFIDSVMEASTQRKQKERGANATVMEAKLKELIISLAQRDSPRKRQGYVSGMIARIHGMVRDFFRSHSSKEMQARVRSATVDAKLQKLDMQDLTITRDVFKMWLQDPDMLEMLDYLDIGTANKTELFDVLDCDLSGELELPEVISGLMKLRGPSEKSDIVAALLGVRYMTTLLEELHKKVCGPKRSARKATIMMPVRMSEALRCSKPPG